MYHGGRYGAFALVAGIKANEVRRTSCYCMCCITGCRKAYFAELNRSVCTDITDSARAAAGGGRAKRSNCAGFIDTDEDRYYVEDAEVMYIVAFQCSVWRASSPLWLF